jgi:uncharacterized protein (DUF433 family)
MSTHLRGAYTADRAAALSGVPKSTVHYWARRQILIPSVSSLRIKLWSYADLMGLRTIQWLRHEKASPRGGDVPAASMTAVRRALATLAELDLSLWTEDGGPRVAVDAAGRVFVLSSEGPQSADGQRAIDEDMLDLVAPFDVGQQRGPDLHAPRPRLRIVPGKLGGAPHVHGTRLESEALAALNERGIDRAAIARLYPGIAGEAIDEALDLEAQLRGNVALAA